MLLFSGKVFNDYNSNGIEDNIQTFGKALDFGIGGVKVSAFDINNIEMDTAITSSNPATLGQYTLSNLSKNTKYRIQLDKTTFPLYYMIIHSTIIYQMEIKHLLDLRSQGTNNVNFSIAKPCEYCEDNAKIYSSIHRRGKNITDGLSVNEGTVFSFLNNSTTGTDVMSFLAQYQSTQIHGQIQI